MLIDPEAAFMYEREALRSLKTVHSHRNLAEHLKYLQHLEYFHRLRHSPASTMVPWKILENRYYRKLCNRKCEDNIKETVSNFVQSIARDGSCSDSEWTSQY